MKVKIFRALSLAGFVFLTAPIQSLFAEESSRASILPSEAKPTVDGELFEKIFMGSSSPSNKLIEYVRDEESFEKWTKLVGYAYKKVPGLDNSPTKFAGALGQTVKTSNPGAQFQIAENPATGEVLIDFLTWPKDGSYMEFNVFKIKKSGDGLGIYTLQLANRFPFFKDTTEASIAPFKKLRESWLKQAAEFDMNKVEALLN